MIKNKRKKIFCLFLLVVVLSIVAAIIVFRPSMQIVDEEATLKSRDLYEVFMESGVIYPRNRIVIKSPFDGRIEKVCVNEGDLVKKGQVIALMSSLERAFMVDTAATLDGSTGGYKKLGTIFKITPVLSPIDGFVISKNKGSKQTVNFKDEILVIADNLIVYVDINEVDLKYIKIGSKLSMCLDAYPEKQFVGVVEHISYEAINRNNVTVYAIKIKPLCNMNDIFRSGMSVTVTIPVGYKINALSIPINFISEKGQKKVVVVKNGNFKKPVFNTREVKTGITDGKFIEVISGLNVGETVVTFKFKSKSKSVEY